MSTRQGNLKDFQGNKIAPNTCSAAVLDEARNRGLSASLAYLVEKNAFGFPTFVTTDSYSAGTILFYDRKLWVVKAGGHAAGAWDLDDFEEYPLGLDVLFLNQALGKYSNTSEITLSQAKAGKYVNVSGAEVSESGYGISSPISLNKGDILLIPSASAVPAAVSVVARVVTRTYDKVIAYTYTYQQANPELYDTATADYDSSLVYTAVYDTSGETPVLTGWTKGGQTYETLPATHEVTESYYEALVQQAVSAMPSTGYYVYLCPQAMTVVISGYTATVNGGVCKVVGLGIFKNIATNFVGVPGQSVLAQALCDLLARVEGICERLENLGDTKAKCIDFEDIPKVCDGPMVIEGTGSPSVLPRFVGQRYHDTTANAKHLYEAFAVTGNLSDWVLIM